MTSRRLLALASAALVFAACGSDATSDVAGGPPHVAQVMFAEVTVTG